MTIIATPTRFSVALSGIDSAAITSFPVLITVKALCDRKKQLPNRVNRPLQKRERTGKEYGCFPFVWKTKIFKWKINYILESLPRIEVFGGGKCQNGSSTNATQNREFLWVGHWDRPRNYKGLYGILQLLQGSHMDNFPQKTLKLVG